ncbi:hypothetical protein [Prochlorothrix hollandica]|uniref:hypothetical protein n=1 Tax=Prochlorothrix hollandica TaxID=1223 RepID=UPI0003451300|nr:hypothetical protein [Prochlorothrix hollandica]
MHYFPTHPLHQAPIRPLATVARFPVVAIAALGLLATTAPRSFAQAMPATTPASPTAVTVPGMNPAPAMPEAIGPDAIGPDAIGPDAIGPDAIGPETTATQAIATGATQRLRDGVYVYGQSSQPEEIGQVYMVFEAQADQMVGAFYMPFSSFDCFQGSLEADRLALTITDSYSAETSSYAVALDSGDPQASDDLLAPFDLEGFQPLDEVSDNDRQILGVCKDDYRL